MTFHSFRLLTPRVQVAFILMRGTYLAYRWEKAARLKLYYRSDDARGFFIEVERDTHEGQAVVLRSFSSSESLQDYTQGVRRP